MFPVSPFGDASSKMGPHPPLQYCRWTFWQQDSIYLATIKVVAFLQPWTQQMDFFWQSYRIFSSEPPYFTQLIWKDFTCWLGLGSDHYMVSTYATELWMSKSEDNPQKTSYENKTTIVFIKHSCDWTTIYRCHILEQIRGKLWHRTGHMHGAMQGEGKSFSCQGTLYYFFNPYAKSTNKKLN
jgi:hypothetical protein